MEPEPPPITITDPHAPPGTADLLDTGPDRWRPSAYQKGLAALTAVIVALICGGVAAIRHIDHERALDRASVRAVSVYASLELPPLDPSQETTPPDVSVSLANLGRDTIRLLTVRVDDTGVPLPTGGVVLQTGSSFSHALPAEPCTPDAGRARTRVVTAELRTSRGQQVRRRIVLEGTQLTEVNALLRRNCRTWLPPEAFQVSLVSVERRGDVVTLKLRLNNSSLMRMRALRVLALPGLRVQGRPLPLELPPQEDPDAQTSTERFEVALTVVDCSAFRQYQLEAFEEPAILLALDGELEDGIGRIPFFLGTDDTTFTSVLDSLSLACPDVLAGEPEPH